MPKTVGLAFRLLARTLLALLMAGGFLLSPGAVRAASPAFWLQSSNTGWGDNFGRALAVDGNTMLVGAYGGYAGGAAYIFVRSGETWVEQAKLMASNGTPADLFGYAVALQGDTALVGAYQSNAEAGAAYVFVRQGGYWTQQAKLTAADSAPGDWFGCDVALDGDTAIIGACPIGQKAGAAYVFVRQGESWAQQAKLMAGDGLAAGGFGAAVALDGETVVVGAYRAGQGAGAAYIFQHSGTTWAEQARLTASDGEAGDWLGADVALQGDTALVGAQHSNHDAGAAYVFVRQGGAWTQQARLTASDSTEGDFFGYAIALSGNTAVAGAYHHYQYSGAAFLFRRSGTSWTQTERFAPTGGLAPQDWFGYAVAADEATVLVGAPRWTQRGGVYVTPNPGGGLTAPQTVTLPVRTLPANSVTASAAALHGELASLGSASSVSVYFEYGLDIVDPLTGGTAAYTKSTPPQVMTEPDVFSASISGLRGGEKYHFRAVADGGASGISYGPDMGFTTLAPATGPGGKPPAATEEKLTFSEWFRLNYRLLAAITIILAVLSFFISRRVQERRDAGQVPAPVTRRPNYEAALKKMEELVSLRSQGLINETDYAARKAEILRELHAGDSAGNNAP